MLEASKLQYWPAWEIQQASGPYNRPQQHQCCAQSDARQWQTQQRDCHAWMYAASRKRCMGQGKLGAAAGLRAELLPTCGLVLKCVKLPELLVSSLAAA